MRKMGGSKLIKIIAGCTLCLFLLTICTYAHSGKTDYAGGHYNNSTGEYHYHHGYSAHSHYDMDGDGDIDCPYEFNDKTNHNNSSNNSNSSNNNSNSSNNSNNNSIVSENNTENSKNKITFGKVIEVIFLIIPCSLITLYFLYMFFGFIYIIIELICEKFLKVNIEKSIKERILRILLIIGLVLLVPLEMLFLLGIL